MYHQYQKYVPVVDANQVPLMPTKWSRAWRWVRTGKATYFYKNGILCVRLNKDPSDRKYQDTAVSLDTGSKFEGYSVKSENKTYLNVQADTRSGVKDAMEFRSMMRRNRRQRKTPYRQCRINRYRSPGYIAPSILARWQWRLKVLKMLINLFPIRYIIVEDAKFSTIKDVNKTEYVKTHNTIVSWVQNGKNWFYRQLETLWPNISVYKVDGYETCQMRTGMGLAKSKDKSLMSFWSHCVDAWVVASKIVGCSPKVDNLDIIHLRPIRYPRRQLHYANPVKSGYRKPYGGTVSLGLVKGTIVNHVNPNPKRLSRGLGLVGGTSEGRISLHDIHTYHRLDQDAKVEHCHIVAYRPFLLTHYYYTMTLLNKTHKTIKDCFSRNKPKYKDLFHHDHLSLNYYTRSFGLKDIYV